MASPAMNTEKVLKAAADMAGWGTRKLPAGHAMGVCYCGYPTYWQTHIAMITEVSVDKKQAG